MKKILLIVLALIMCVGMAVGFTGCEQRQANMVSYNLSLEADNFNIIRQITVINCIKGDVLFQMTGRISITADTADKQLEVTVQVEKDKYKKHS